MKSKKCGQQRPEGRMDEKCRSGGFKFGVLEGQGYIQL